MKRNKVITRILLTILACGMLFITCKDDANDNSAIGDYGGIISQPPSSPGGSSGVYVDSNGALRINATVYIPGVDGFVSNDLAANETITAFLWRPESGKSTPDYTGNISSGTVTINIPAPKSYTLNPISEYFPGTLKSADVQITNLLLSTPDFGDATMLGLFVDPVFEPDNVRKWWDIIIGEEYCFYYSKGSTSISGIGSEYGYSYIIDIIFVEGWNIVCEKFDETSNTFSMISKSPKANARWVFTGMK